MRGTSRAAPNLKWLADIRIPTVRQAYVPGADLCTDLLGGPGTPTSALWSSTLTWPSGAPLPRRAGPPLDKVSQYTRSILFLRRPGRAAVAVGSRDASTMRLDTSVDIKRRSLIRGRLFPTAEKRRIPVRVHRGLLHLSAPTVSALTAGGTSPSRTDHEPMSTNPVRSNLPSEPDALNRHSNSPALTRPGAFNHRTGLPL